MADGLNVFRVECDGQGYTPEMVGDVEDLTGQSLQEFVDGRANLAQQSCIKAADGLCKLSGVVRSWSEEGMVDTGMGGYTPGMVSVVSLDVMCGMGDCPSDQPQTKFARALDTFTRLAGQVNHEVGVKIRPLEREASDKANAIVEPTEAEAEATITQPARERADAILAEAEAEVKRFTKSAKAKARRVRTAASKKVGSIRTAAIDDAWTEAESTSSEETQLF